MIVPMLEPFEDELICGLAAVVYGVKSTTSTIAPSLTSSNAVPGQSDSSESVVAMSRFSDSHRVHVGSVVSTAVSNRASVEMRQYLISWQRQLACCGRPQC